MTQTGLTRRQALQAGAALGSFAITGPARAAKPFTPSESLVEAARKEGKITLYTATFVEVEQEVVNEFRKKFPFIRIEMIRAPGGQLITRVKTEAASGKLAADVLIHSDRGLTKGIEHIFADYAPPNATDYLPESLISPKLWPTLTAGWSIAYNSELVKNPPKTWMDLTKPEYGDGQIAQVIAQSGGTTWTRVMFERQVLGEDYWARQAATQAEALSLGSALLGCAGARRVLDCAAGLQHRLSQAARWRADQDVLPARGRADRPLWVGHSEDRAEPERRAAVYGLAAVGGRANLPDQAAR